MPELLFLTALLDIGAVGVSDGDPDGAAFGAAFATDWGLGRLADTAELVLSELFSNAVRHARSPRGRQIETRYEHVDGAVRIEVHDANENWQSGRGLALVDALTGSRWGVSEREGVGKRVWAVVADDAAIAATLTPPSDDHPHEMSR